MIKTIRKLYYALFLVALAETEEQYEFAKNVICHELCEFKKAKYGIFTINEHEQKMIEKLFDVKFERGKEKELLDILIKVGVRDYVKEIINDYELDDGEHKILEEFIK